MQLMHRLNCLNCSSSSCDCRTGPSSTAFSLARMIHGFTLLSLSMKPSSSTTRSRTTGKFASGATSTVSPSSESASLQVRLGLPLTIIPQLPHTAIRHDQRCASVPSISSLMKLSASRTFQSG